MDSTTVSNSSSKANAFNTYFASVFTHEDLSSIPHIDGTPFPMMAPITISTDKVVHQLLNIQSNKASGPDKILAFFQKRQRYQLHQY